MLSTLPRQSKLGTKDAMYKNLQKQNPLSGLQGGDKRLITIKASYQGLIVRCMKDVVGSRRSLNTSSNSLT